MPMFRRSRTTGSADAQPTGQDNINTVSIITTRRRPPHNESSSAFMTTTKWSEMISVVAWKNPLMVVPAR